MAVSLVKRPRINLNHPARPAIGTGRPRINYVHPDRVRVSTINLNHPYRPAIGAIIQVAA